MKKKSKTIYRTIHLISGLIVVILFFAGADAIFGETVGITIFPDRIIGKINPLIFGNNMIGYDPTTYENWTKYYVGYSNYGAGIWDPQGGHSVQEVIELAKEAGITIARFPGGSQSDFYNWKKTIGNREGRPNFLYGLDEFLKTCQEINCEVVFTLNYFTGTPQDAADLLEYLNAPNNGSNPGGGKDWADERAKNGHPEPYHIKYFELGNEVYGGIPQKGIPKADPEQYGRDYLQYREKMLATDPSVLLGAVIHSWEFRHSPWNERLFEIAGKSIDFLIEHTYRPYYTLNNEKVNPDKLFTDSLASLEETDKYYKNLSRQFEMATGRKKIPIAITEYNAGFVQDKPVPFRHSLGTALINAGFLQIFMKPENNILMANYWQYVNSYWGMIKNDLFMEGKGHYIKRPNYYVYELYNKHFGNILIDTDVKSDIYVTNAADVYKTNSGAFILKIGDRTTTGENLLSNNWQISDFNGVSAKEINGVLEIDYNDPKEFNYFHSKKSATVQPDKYYRLSGFIKTEQLNDKEGVSLEVTDGRGWPKVRSAANTEKIYGTIDWQFVDVVYKTLSDAESIQVIARRIGEKGPLKGKAFFKDVRFEQYIATDTHTPYLSVNASKSQDGEKIYLMVINKNMEKPISGLIGLKDFLSAGIGDSWVLNGPSVDATNENKADDVKISYKNVEINNNSFEYTFEPHSLTAIEIKIKK